MNAHAQIPVGGAMVDLGCLAIDPTIVEAAAAGAVFAVNLSGGKDSAAVGQAHILTVHEPLQRASRQLLKCEPEGILDNRLLCGRTVTRGVKEGISGSGKSAPVTCIGVRSIDPV